jgi:hypothetical protein
MNRVLGLCALLLLVLVNASCSQDYARYRNFLDCKPRSVLVLPPINNTAEVRASDACLSMFTQPLADHGYYVYPIAVVDRLFKDNGVPMPGDMHNVTLEKINEIIGPDAVLYITIKEWTTTYIVINTSSTVTLDTRLVDAKTGKLLWGAALTYTYSSSQNSGGGGVGSLVAMLINAQIQAIASAASDGAYERMVAQQAFQQLFIGYLWGPRNSNFEAQQKDLREKLAKQDAEAAKNAAN